MDRVAATASLDLTVPGSIVAAALVRRFDVKFHPGQLHSEFSRLQYRWAFNAKHADIVDVRWSDIVSMAVLDHPVVSHTRSGLGNYNTGFDVFFLPSCTGNMFLDSDCHVDGAAASVSLRTVLSSWQRAGIRLTCKDSRGVDHFVGVCQPLSFLHLLMHAVETSICIVDCTRPGRWPSTALCGYFGCALPGTVQSQSHSAPVASLTPTLFRSTAAHMRALSSSSTLSTALAVDGFSCLDVLVWLDIMGMSNAVVVKAARQVLAPGASPTCNSFAMLFLLQCLKLSGLLKGNRHLDNAVGICGELCGMVPDWAQAGEVHLPSPSTLSRYNFVLDAGYCDVMRQRFELLLSPESEPWVGFLLCDSSPRAGKDVMLTELYYLTESGMIQFQACQDCLIRILTGVEPADEDVEKQMLAEMTSTLKRHVLIPCAMGVSNAGLACKFAAVLHQLRMETTGWTQVKSIMSNVFCVTTDMGTESGVSFVPPVHANLLWPHWDESIPGLCEDDELPVFNPDDDLLSFDSTLPVPGVEHATHGALKHVTTALETYVNWDIGARAISKLLCSRLYLDRLQHRCLQGPRYAGIREALRAGVRQPIEHRFLSMLEFLNDVVPLRHDLIEAFNGSAMFGEEASTPKASEYIDTKVVCQAMTSKEFWGYAVMVQCLGMGCQVVTFASRSCICHSHTFHGGGWRSVDQVALSQKVLARRIAKSPCPAKGLMAPAFSCGHLEKLLNESFSTLRCHLQAELAGMGLSREGRDSILSEFESGAAFLKFEVGVKIASWTQLPLQLCALGEQMDLSGATLALSQATRCYDETTTSSKHRSLTHLLLSPQGPFRQHIDAYIASGCDATVMHASLHPFVRRFRMVRTNEISVEGLHRDGTVGHRKAPNHSLPYMSVHLRYKEMFNSGPDTLLALATSCDSLRTESSIVRHFGLWEHPSWQAHQNIVLSASSSTRDARSGRFGSYKLARNLFYKGDLDSQFQKFASVQSVVDSRRRHLDRQEALEKRASAENVDLSLFNPQDFADKVFCNHAFKFFKETCKVGSKVYLMRTENDVARVSMSHVVGTALQHQHGALLDEGSELNDLIRTASSSTLKAFTVVNAHPKRRKVMPSASSQLRSDHVAIMPLAVAERSRDGAAEAFLTVSSLVYHDDIELEMLGFESFKDLTMVQLKRMHHGDFAEGSTYVFGGRPLPPCCHSSTARGFLSDLVASDAYPLGKQCLFVGSPSLALLEVIDALVQHGYIETPLARWYRITDFGWPFLSRQRNVCNMRHLFKRRKLLPITSWTTWELMDLLVEQGFELQRLPRGSEPTPLSLRDFNPMTNKVFYVDKFANVHKDYLLCLARIDDLVALENGPPEIRHKQSVGWYAQCLLGETPGESSAPQSALVDDTPMTLMICDADADVNHDAIDGGASDEMDAWQDAEELLDDTPDFIPPPDLLPPSPKRLKSHAPLKTVMELGRETWGTFKFMVIRSGGKPGKVQLSVKCCYHRDPSDPAGTHCTKGRKFVDGDVEDFARVRLQLRHWCLAGRTRPRRALPKAQAHKHIEPEMSRLDVDTEREQDILLQQGLDDPNGWVIGGTALQPPDSDDGSSSSTSSS